MVRRPPRSTLFPYTNALPISTEVLNPTPATCPTPFLIPVAKLSPQALAILSKFPKPSNLDASGNDTTVRSEEHTSELQSLAYLVCRLLLEKKKKHNTKQRSAP